MRIVDFASYKPYIVISHIGPFFKNTYSMTISEEYFIILVLQENFFLTNNA